MEYSETTPIQYQEGNVRFLGMDILVDSRVLIPRPETELLVNVVRDEFLKTPHRKPFILDIGTGSGAIALGLRSLINDCKIMASDVSNDALNVAGENIRRFKREDSIELVHSDMFSAFNEEYEHFFDCVVSNPPYVSRKDYEKVDAWVKAEPKIALLAGEDGMDYLEKIVKGSPRIIKHNGLLAVEIGYDQAEKVKTLFNDNGFSDVRGIKDINGYERVIMGRKNG